MATRKKEQQSSQVEQSWVVSALAQAKERQSSLTSLSRLISDGEAVWSKVLFPTQRLENWKYTNTDAIAKGAFGSLPKAAGLVLAETVAPFRAAAPDAFTIVFVDGIFSSELSSLGTVEKARVSRFSDGGSEGVGGLAPHAEDSFAALATALLTDGISVTVERGAVVERAIHVIHVATAASNGCVVTPRLFVQAEEGSQVTILESHVSVGGERYLSLPVAEFVAADGAIVDYYKYQDESLSACHVSNSIVQQGRAGSVSMHFFSFGGSLVRNTISARLQGSGANCVLNGLSVLGGVQHVDNSTTIHHIEPSIESREHFKGIYSDASKGVFSGTITVDQIAQKTNAFQSNQALLLSPNASIETRPQLMIWADDVKCTHGATVGQLDDEAMFYLRSRGIGFEEARNFLIHAFASEVLTTVKLPQFKEYVEGRITESLGR